jgi:DNA-3-methyladenine glycosylase I
MSKCLWALASASEECYHDQEWGVPLHDDVKLLEFLVLEGAQAGLSWRTVLNKREGYRRAFDDFDAEKIAAYGDHKIIALMSDSNIVRNRAKIQSAVANARGYLRVRDDYGSFDAYIWQFVGNVPKQNAWSSPAQVPSFSVESELMSRDMQQRGFKFVGKTICYAYMQAVGMVNDHTTDCFRYSQIAALSKS